MPADNMGFARSLNVMDDFNREALQLSIDTGLPSAKVVVRLEELIEWRGRPEKVRVDNGPEFISEKLKNWCSFHGIELHFILPGKPAQESLIERFNRTFRADFLDVCLFENLVQMRNHAEIWMWKYNNERLRSALQHSTPRDFLLEYGKISHTNPADFSTFQQSFSTTPTGALTKNSTFECY